jgi:hypothetical protein
MLPPQIRDRRVLHLDDLDRRGVVLHQLMDLSCDMDPMQLVHLLHLDVVQNLDGLDHRHRLDVALLDERQNLDEARLVVVHRDEQLPLVAVVDVELLHLLRMDCFLDVVDVEPPRLQRMDYFLDVVHLDVVHLELAELQVLQELPVHLELLCMQQLQPMLPALPHVMPSALQDQHLALLQVLRQALD